jgi:hypothetical protein
MENSPDYPSIINTLGEVAPVVVPLPAMILFSQECQRGGDGRCRCWVKGGVGSDRLGATL